MVRRSAPLLLAALLVSSPAPARADVPAAFEIATVKLERATVDAVAPTLGPSATTGPMASPAGEAESPLNTGPGIAIAAILVGLMLWLRTRLGRR